MNQVAIENAVVKSTVAEPQRHSRFAEEGITNEIVGARCECAYFIAITAQTLNERTKPQDARFTDAFLSQQRC